MLREAFQLSMKIWLGDLRGRWFENLMEYALIVYSGLLLLWQFDDIGSVDLLSHFTKVKCNSLT